MSNCYKCDNCNKHFDYKLNQVEVKDEIKLCPRKEPVLGFMRGYSSTFGKTYKLIRYNSKLLDLCDKCYKRYVEIN